MEEVIKKILGKNVLSFRKLPSKSKLLYCVSLPDKTFRLDLLNPNHSEWYLKITNIQNFANENGIEVPKVLETGFEGNYFYRVSEWISGDIVFNVQESDEVILKCGDVLGRMNKVKNRDNLFVTNSDFTGRNLVWTKDKKVFAVDTDAMKLVPEKSLDITVVKSLLTWKISKRQIFLFLSSYSKHRDASNILKIVEERKWRW